MAFSFRKILSNINYFGKPGDPDYTEVKSTQKRFEESTEGVFFERTEPDSTSRYAKSLKLTESVKNFAVKKSSLSDTDILNVQETPTTEKTKLKKSHKKLKLDVDSKPISESLDSSDETPSENTPKHMLLEAKSADIFKSFDFNKSFDFDLSDSETENNVDIQSLSEYSDSDGSNKSIEEVKMCHKVRSVEDENLVRSTSTESFRDVELDRNEEERISLLLSYQEKLEKMEGYVKKLLSEFQFNIEVSKIFHCRSLANNEPIINDKGVDSRGPSPSGPWNFIVEREDVATKQKFRKQLQTLKHTIDEFANGYLNKSKEKKPVSRHMRNKKRIRHFDFPDLRDALINLFTPEENHFEELDSSKCVCACHLQFSTDSGVTTKSDERSLSNQSITSSIGNFSLDSSTLTAYSESLDQIVSYNSFQDTSLYGTLLQKTAMERITFYVQVHSMQLKCEAAEDTESKNVITFYCPTCKITETDENSLLRHILSQKHCEKIHFQYKTVYIKKCVAAGKEIQPSTVLNPMTMYRDDNKIVCFGDAMYACSLCFENLIVGESVLMAHCADSDHVERREKLDEIIE